MKHKRNLKRTAALALMISIVGFFVDGDPREESLFTNIFEIGLMTTILFLIFSSAYLIIDFLSKLAGLNDITE